MVLTQPIFRAFLKESEAVKLLKVGSSWYDQMIYLCEFIFVLATVFSTIRELWEFKKLKFSYFSHNWNVAECCIIVFSYIEIFLYFYRYSLTSAAVSDFYRTKGNEYVRIDYAALVDQYFHYILSFIMFISVLKLIKLLQFNEQMRVLARTIHLCWEELSYFFLMFAVIFFSFCWIAPSLTPCPSIPINSSSVTVGSPLPPIRRCIQFVK